MRGGNRINRISYTKQEIEFLVKDYKQHENKLYSPILKKTCRDIIQWRTSITYHLDKPSTNYFFFLLEPPHFSIYSGEQLTEDDFSYSDAYKSYKGWKKYTLEERKRLIWKKHKRTLEQCANISKGLQDFYSTSNGKIVREKQNKKSVISLKKYWQTEEGKQNRTEAKKKQSATMKEKIRNGTFTPPITNTFTHWKAEVMHKGVFLTFRSSWEACFFLCYPYLEYETLRIKYKTNSIEKTYIADFYDEKNKTVYELKPIECYNRQKDKMNAIINYCIENDLKFIWINEHNLKQYIKKEMISPENMLQYNKIRKYIEG